ncbi:MAG: hypothetical protein Q7R76_01335 [Candidatus Woesearchaeota archaeon]|nr:hypothetical protein [Candidatus Woesearchaeota archaeon]
MHFRNNSIEDAVQNELLHQALTLAHHKHAAMHKKDEKFELHVIEDTSKLSHAVEQKNEQEKTEHQQDQQKEEQHHHDANYHPVSDKYDAQFHVDTLKNCMIGCDCGWTAHLTEFLNEDIVRVETKTEKEKPYHRAASYTADSGGY